MPPFVLLLIHGSAWHQALESQFFSFLPASDFFEDSFVQCEACSMSHQDITIPTKLLSLSVEDLQRCNDWILSQHCMYWPTARSKTRQQQQEVLQPWSEVVANPSWDLRGFVLTAWTPSATGTLHHLQPLGAALLPDPLRLSLPLWPHCAHCVAHFSCLSVYRIYGTPAWENGWNWFVIEVSTDGPIHLVLSSNQKN